MAKTWCCPFFSWEDGLKVYCEGACVAFRTQEVRQKYINRYCAAVPGWEGCPIAEQLVAAYEKEDTDEGAEY